MRRQLSVEMHSLDSGPGLVGLRFPFNKAFHEKIKPIPGVRYAPEFGKGTWTFPTEPICLAQLARFAKACGWRVTDKRNLVKPKKPRLSTRAKKLLKDLLPHQRLAALRVQTDRRLLVAFDPGLGKTITAYAALDMAACKRVLIVGPAIARDVWASERLKWGVPGAIQLLEKGKDPIQQDARWLVCSYALLKPVVTQLQERDLALDGLVFDESHYLKDDRTKRTQLAGSLVQGLPTEALVLELTGTPVTKDPADFRAQGNILHPGRYGMFTKFGERYCKATLNEYAPSGYDYYGLNEEYEDELLARLDAVMIRVTADEVADELPPLYTGVLRIKPKRKFKAREVSDLFTGEREQHTERMDAHSLKMVESKVAYALKWIEQQYESGNKRLVLFTQLRATAQEIVDRSPHFATLISGAVSAKERGVRIKQLHASMESVAVCTMASVGVAVDLTFASHVLFVELPYTPGQLDQSFRRCYRLSSKHRVSIEFLVAQGSADELLIHTLSERLKAYNKIQRGSDSQRKLETALVDSGETDTEFYDRLTQICADADESLDLSEGYF